MPKPASKSTIAKAAPDRAAIERWEGEGGRAFALEESLVARPGALPGSDTSEEISLSSLQMSSARESATRSSS